jgi:hypothetical protein
VSSARIGTRPEDTPRAKRERVPGAEVELPCLDERTVVPQLELATTGRGAGADPLEPTWGKGAFALSLPGLDPETPAVELDRLAFESQCECDRVHRSRR